MKNKKIFISIFVIFITIIFIYFMSIISENNKCKGVRVYNSECKK